MPSSNRPNNLSICVDAGDDCGRIEAATGDWTIHWPPNSHRMMTGGGWGVGIRPAEQGQPSFASSSWFIRIQRQFLPLCRKSQPSDHVRKNRFRRIIMNVMHYDPTKAFSINLFIYEDLMHNNLASWLNRIDEIVDSGRERDGGLALVRQSISLFGWLSESSEFSGLVTEFLEVMGWTP